MPEKNVFFLNLIWNLVLMKWDFFFSPGWIMCLVVPLDICPVTSYVADDRSWSCPYDLNF